MVDERHARIERKIQKQKGALTPSSWIETNETRGKMKSRTGPYDECISINVHCEAMQKEANPRDCVGQK